MVEALLHDIARVEYGALVLFTSREQMRQAVDAAAHRHAQRGAGAKRTAAHATAQAPPRAGGERRALGHLWHAVVWRGAGFARAAVRIGLYHQAALRPARRPGGRGPRRMAARRRPRPVQRTGGARHRHPPGAMGGPRHSHRRRHGACVLLRQAPHAHQLRAAPAQGLPPFALEQRAPL